MVHATRSTLPARVFAPNNPHALAPPHSRIRNQRLPAGALHGSLTAPQAHYGSHLKSDFLDRMTESERSGDKHGLVVGF
jgi:hypothetical protein